MYHGAQEVRSFLGLGARRWRYFSKEHRCSVHTWWLLLASQPVCSFHPCLLKASEGRHLPLGGWTYREQFIADPSASSPSHFGLNWLTVNTQPGVGFKKVCWVLVLASFCWPPSWHFDQAGGWYHLAGSLARMPLPGQTGLSGEPALDHEARSKAHSGEAHWKFPLPSENHNQRNLMLISWR